MNVKRIAITGPESTGKSYLSLKLAEHFKSPYVSEYAREYCEGMDLNYKITDLEHIARKQIENEALLMQKADSFIFCDTELIVIKIWAIHAFGHCPEWIEQAIKQNHYDLYLLCNTDIPWEYDPMREHPNQREFLFKWYEKELKSYGFNYKVVSGLGEDRINNAISFVDYL
ncbi:MAG: AAA family ATPase [Hyphomicrobiales bacterium]